MTEQDDSVRVYYVGGCVRDEILGVKAKDFDFSVEAPSWDAMRAWIAARGRIFQEAPQYFTIRAHVKNAPAADFVLCRKEGAYDDGRRPSSVEPGTLFDDLARRDFTMNAIAKPLDGGDYIDPHAGRTDITRRTIRCVGVAEERFTEDALRLLRAIRFAITKDFALAPSIHACLCDHAFAQKLSAVSVERQREELNKCFEHSTAQTLRYLEIYPAIREVLFSGPMKLEATLKVKVSR